MDTKRDIRVVRQVISTWGPSVVSFMLLLGDLYEGVLLKENVGKFFIIVEMRV